MELFYQIHEVNAALTANNISLFQVLITLAIVYTVAVYNVGVKLTTLQTALMNTTYILIYCHIVIGHLSLKKFFIESSLLAEVLFSEDSDVAIGNFTPATDYSGVVYGVLFSATVDAAILLLTLAFGWSIRHGHRRIAAPHLQSDNGEEEEQ